MDPPEDAIEVTQGTVWVDDGIIIARANGVPGTPETVSEAFGVFRDLTGGVPAPMLFDARDWPPDGPTVWSTAVANIESAVSAIAMLVDPDSSVEVGPFPEAIARLLIPMRVFTDEAEALAFLRESLPSE